MSIINQPSMIQPATVEATAKATVMKRDCAGHLLQFAAPKQLLQK